MSEAYFLFTLLRYEVSWEGLVSSCWVWWRKILSVAGSMVPPYGSICSYWEMLGICGLVSDNSPCESWSTSSRTLSLTSFLNWSKSPWRVNLFCLGSYGRSFICRSRSRLIWSRKSFSCILPFSLCFLFISFFLSKVDRSR